MLTFLALQGAPYIYDISRLRVNTFYTKNGMFQQIEYDRMFGACSKLWKEIKILSEIRNMKIKIIFNGITILKLILVRQIILV
jgi:hypothetical protein